MNHSGLSLSRSSCWGRFTNGTWCNNLHESGLKQVEVLRITPGLDFGSCCIFISHFHRIYVGLTFTFGTVISNVCQTEWKWSPEKKNCVHMCVLYTHCNASSCAAISPCNYFVISATKAFIRAENISVCAEWKKARERYEARRDKKLLLNMVFSYISCQVKSHLYLLCAQVHI